MRAETRKAGPLSKITIDHEDDASETTVSAQLDSTHVPPTFGELGVRDEIVRAIIREYGLVDTDEIPHDAFWAIVARHALPLEEAQ